MGKGVSDPLICLSANGDTVCRSKQAALRMLVTTANSVIELRRTKLGEPWQVSRNDILPGRHVSALSLDTRTGRLYACVHFKEGLLVSDDGGETWEPRNNGLESDHAYTILIQHVGDKTVLNLGTEPVMFYRSFDEGETWQKFPSCLDAEEKEKWLFPRSVPHIKHIASHPLTPETIFICVEQGDLLRTDDGGKTWRSVASMDQPDDKFRRDMHRVIFQEDDPNEIMLTSGIGLYRSVDGGEHWETLTDIHFRMGYPDPFFIDPRNPNVMYMIGAGVSPNPDWGKAGSAFPLFLRSRDRGKTWDDGMNGVRQPVPGNIEAAAMHFSEEGGLELFMGTSCGELYTSNDGGHLWHLITDQIDAVSKGPHFRHFLKPEARKAYEEGLQEYEERVKAEWALIV